MTTLNRIGLTCLTAGLLAATCLSAGALASDTPEIPATPAAITKIIAAQPFALNAGFQSDWSAARPTVTAGYLLVLQVDPDLVFPHQVATPVLYVGQQTAERLNIGYDSGHVIAIVASEVDDAGQLTLDLSQQMIWFGTPALPEQITATDIEDEHTLAQAAGIKPMPKGQMDQALKNGGVQLTLADKHALLKEAAPLVERYAPTENHIADVLAGRVGK